MNRDRQAEAIVIALLAISWFPIQGPFQLISYLAPPLLMILGLALGWVRIQRRSAMLLAGVFGISSLISILLWNKGWLHAGLGWITYGALWLFAFSLEHSKPERLFRVFLNSLAVITFFEGLLGLLQVFVFNYSQWGLDLDAGDSMIGTLVAPQAHLFALKMWFQAFLLWIGWRESRKNHGTARRFRIYWISAAVLAMTCALIASANAVNLALLAATAGYLGFFLIKRVLRGDRWDWNALRPKLISSIAAILLVVGFLWKTQPENCKTLIWDSTRLIEGSRYNRPNKVIGLSRSLQLITIERPRYLLFGTGLGSYSSRSAMLLSGEYLKDQPSWMPISVTPWTQEKLLTLWNRLNKYKYEGAVRSQPFSSGQSVLVEFGLVGSLLFALAIYGPLAKGRVSRYWPWLFACLSIAIFVDLWLEYACFMILIGTLQLVASTKEKTLP